MEINNKRKNHRMGISVLFFFVLIILINLYFWKPSPPAIEIVNSIDISTNDKKNPLPVSAKSVAYFNSTSTKFLKAIDSLSEKIIISLETDKEKKEFSIPKLEIDRNFSLMQKLNLDTVLTLKYDINNQKINLVLEGTSFVIDGTSYKTKERVIYTKDKIFKDSLIRTPSNKLIILSEYNNDYSLNVEDWQSKPIEVYSKSLNINLLDDINSIISTSCGNQVKESASRDKIIIKRSSNLECNKIINKRIFDDQLIYVTEYDVESELAEKISYYYNFHNGNEWTIREGVLNKTIEKTNKVSLVLDENIISSASSFSLYLYGPIFSKELIYKNIILSGWKKTYDYKVNIDKNFFEEDNLLLKINSLGNNKIGKINNESNNILDQVKLNEPFLNCSTEEVSQNSIVEQDEENCIKKNLPVQIKNDTRYILTFEYNAQNLEKPFKVYYNFHDGVNWNTYEELVQPKDLQWQEYKNYPKINLKNIKSMEIRFSIEQGNSGQIVNFRNIQLKPYIAKNITNSILVSEKKKLNNNNIKNYKEVSTGGYKIEFTTNNDYVLITKPNYLWNISSLSEYFIGEVEYNNKKMLILATENCKEKISNNQCYKKISGDYYINLNLKYTPKYIIPLLLMFLTSIYTIYITISFVRHKK